MSARNDDVRFDRMGKFIGEARVYEDISLRQLSFGLCTTAYLNQIENGQREAGKLLTDALLQRLGKPIELFERILDRREFRQWQQRHIIISHLHRGEIEKARVIMDAYAKESKGVLDKQFLQIEEINCRALSGATSKELLTLVQHALEYTMPNFTKEPLDALLFSQAEGHLLLTWLELREQTEGPEAVAPEYMSLFRCLHNPRYDKRARVYLLPFVACHVIERAYCRGQFSQALTVCQETLEELTAEKRLFAYDKLLVWKQRLLNAMGIADDTPKRLLQHLRSIQQLASRQEALLISYEERGNVYCLNQILRDRRILLGMTQEEMAEGICDPRTISRIENQSISPQKELRKLLLQRVNMSGERYDYQIITEHYEDYILCSEYGRAWNCGDLEKAAKLLAELHRHVPDTKTNRQYLLAEDAYMRGRLPESDTNYLSRQKVISAIEKALFITIPLDLNEIDSWPICILSVNELFILYTAAGKYKTLGQHAKSLALLTYIRRCLENNDSDTILYEEFYTQCTLLYASTLGDLGQYKESDMLDLLCIRLSLGNQNSCRLAGNLYDMAWNWVQQLSSAPEKTRSLLQQAYAAAIIAGDPVRQQRIKKYAFKLFGVELTL